MLHKLDDKIYTIGLEGIFLYLIISHECKKLLGKEKVVFFSRNSIKRFRFLWIFTFCKEFEDKNTWKTFSVA